MEARLYVIPGSHPSRTAMMMLERKGIDYKRTDLMPVISKGALRAAGFPGVTVPALKIDGRKVQGSREIAHELDRLVPDPPLSIRPMPTAAPPSRRRRHGATKRCSRSPAACSGTCCAAIAPRWSPTPRAPVSGSRSGSRSRPPRPIVALSARFNEATDDNVRADLAALPGMLQRIDDWIAEGVLGGAELNAADFQIGTSLRLLMTLQDLRGAVESRPAGELAMRVAPDYPGDAPPALPPAWLERLQASEAMPAG